MEQKGIFDGTGDNNGHVESGNRRPAPVQAQEPVQKKNFVPQAEAPQEKEERVMQAPGKEEQAINSAIDTVNKSGVGGDDGSTVSKLEEELLEITDEDEELAEQMLFKGYAEKDVVIPALKRKGTYISICTMTPQDISIVNKIVYDMIRENEDEDGLMNIPDIEITNSKNSFTMALSYIGIDGVDLCEDIVTAKLATLKMAIKKYNELASIGEIDKAEGLLKDIVKNVTIREKMFKQIPTSIVDFISEQKFKFEDRLYSIMNQDAIIPKS